MSDSAIRSIGYFCPMWPPGVHPNGIVTYVSILARQLNALNCRTTILADSLAGGHSEPGVYDVGQTKMSLARRSWNRLLYGVWHRIAADPAHYHLYERALVHTANQAVKDRGIQLIEIEESFGWACALREALPVPICVRLHGPWFRVGPELGHPRDSRYRVRVDRERRAIMGAAGVTAPSRAILEMTRNYYGEPFPPTEVIPNPIEPAAECWDPNRADPNRLVFIGRFDRLKGGDLVIDAFARIVEHVPDARLWFIGPDRGCIGPDGRTWKIEEYVRHRLPAPKAGQVEWLGSLPAEALGPYRRAAFVSLVCSLYETFPYTVLEAMALGCPLVAARVGGIPEILQDDHNALLHDPGNPEDLASKVVALMCDPARAARLGRQAALDCRRKYSPEVVAQQTLAFYDAVLEADRRRPQASRSLGQAGAHALTTGRS